MILFMVSWTGSYHTSWRLKFTPPCEMLLTMCKIKLKIRMAPRLYQDMTRKVCKDFVLVEAQHYLKQTKLKNKCLTK